MNPREKCRGTAFSHREKCEFVEKHEEMEKRMEHIYYIIYIYILYILYIIFQQFSIENDPCGDYPLGHIPWLC